MRRAHKEGMSQREQHEDDSLEQAKDSDILGSQDISDLASQFPHTQFWANGQIPSQSRIPHG